MPATSPAATRGGRAAGLLGAAAVLGIGALALFQPIPPAPPADRSPAIAGRPCTLDPDGFLRGRFFGAINLSADWSGADLSCEGMRRPDGQGIRLFFAREQPGSGRVSVLIGIDGPTDDLPGAERPANVTVIEERTSRFFSTAGPGRCWANINSVTPLSPVTGADGDLRIDGLVYCLGALPSVGDRSSLTLGDLRFAGRLSTDQD